MKPIHDRSEACKFSEKRKLPFRSKHRISTSSVSYSRLPSYLTLLPLSSVRSAAGTPAPSAPLHPCFWLAGVSSPPPYQRRHRTFSCRHSRTPFRPVLRPVVSPLLCLTR